MTEPTSETQREGDEAAAPAVAPKPAAKAAAPAKKPAAPAPVAAPTTPPAAKVTGIGGVKPIIDDGVTLHLAPRFFTDPHVSSGKATYPVRRFEDGEGVPYVVIPGDAEDVAFRTGIILRDGFEGFRIVAPVPGEGYVTDVETRHGELYLIVKPFGAQPATVVEGKVMVYLELSE